MIDHELDIYADMRQAVRDWFIELRRRRKLTQRQLANRLAISRATVDNWERGKHWPRRQSILVLNNIGRDVGMPPFPPVPPEAYKFSPKREQEALRREMERGAS